MATQTKLQTGAWLETPGPNARVVIRNDLPIPSPSKGEVLVKLECTGVCHSDVYGITGQTSRSTNIMGHEGIGRIVEVGPGASQDLLQKRVGVKWLYSYCNECEICEVNVTACPNQHNSGRDVPGTFQQYVVSPIEPLTMIPDTLDSAMAAPLLCAGISIYSAIMKLDLKSGQWLVILGAGGGLGHIGVQIAQRKGSKVIAVDTGEEKRKLCMDLGATCFLDFKTDDVTTEVKKLTNGYGAHGAVCLSGIRAGYELALSVLRNLSSLVPYKMAVHGFTIIGSSVGTKAQLDELLQMAVRGEITTITKVHEFEELDDLLEKLKRNQISGRVVVKIPQ
ncbi:alcohol dehydrogenase [Mollisia scopiformis]|uniref:Alcohol dehydrogenase n=1 Tax=Mollisia scopiformis TaxID=149040 RepID=A0A194WTS9_MOLSC|nr:alcohol dehydrogenase [Mollisia scopiformis]KUJ11356.1 alcohol dehydrogenase [Mollisia scopiformis]